MKELDDYVEQINLEPTDKMLKELGWISNSAPTLAVWFVVGVLTLVLFG
ncbi:hypothetical protein VISI1226_03325 [Vibrio sinaloensis DSM 21326]|uniref:Uncharacterized protein n=1 Tax=Vibrio sinaloensis DSM 21326 TaxID=945550 RepID=E8MB56_PHOS4|nr:hypothetical protein [Vibrio sinaloensis]EGA68639.1 hypothetical protein VISI1226_03325 [Vibrio sinaloensis DSM 21326]